MNHTAGTGNEKHQRLKMETRDDRQEYKKKKAITTSFRIFVPGISSDISNAGHSAGDAITSSGVTAFLIRYTAEKFRFSDVLENHAILAQVVPAGCQTGFYGDNGCWVIQMGI